VRTRVELVEADVPRGLCGVRRWDELVRSARRHRRDHEVRAACCEPARRLIDLVQHYLVPRSAAEPDPLALHDAVVGLPRAHPDDDVTAITIQCRLLVVVDELLAARSVGRDLAVVVGGGAADHTAAGDERGINRRAVLGAEGLETEEQRVGTESPTRRMRFGWGVAAPCADEVACCPAAVGAGCAGSFWPAWTCSSGDAVVAPTVATTIVTAAAANPVGTATRPLQPRSAPRRMAAPRDRRTAWPRPGSWQAAPP
jgi:hypothetical protein